MKTKPILMVSESAHNADMYYVTHFLSNAPFVYLHISQDATGKDILIVSQMEYERAKKESCIKDVRSTFDYGQGLKTEELIVRILQEEAVNAVEVPRYFPLYIAEALKKSGIEVVPVEDFLLTKP